MSQRWCIHSIYTCKQTISQVSLVIFSGLHFQYTFEPWACENHSIMYCTHYSKICWKEKMLQVLIAILISPKGFQLCFWCLPATFSIAQKGSMSVLKLITNSSQIWCWRMSCKMLTDFISFQLLASASCRSFSTLEVISGTLNNFRKSQRIVCDLILITGLHRPYAYACYNSLLFLWKKGL